MIVNVKLINKEEIANETMAFHFEKPEEFAFKAGQFGDFTILNPSETDEEGNVRGFSLSHAPYETDLMITTRMRDTAFKRVLKNLSIGTEVKLDAPYGSFTLHKTETTPAVFLTGGIGITPVRSIIAQASHDKLPHKITLFYSNKTPEDTAFLQDLQSFAKENPNFIFVPVMTRDETWQGEKGHITKDMLTKYIPDLTTPLYYLSGPASMVATMRQILTDAQVNEDNIRTEEFSGY
ncbi:MAG TPA: FAD-dependent oxidoreductase [Patescibacteria group bacterium]|nr:FAD-dependent oxidoreductase [Patescibacteria group bacterium]